MSKLIILRGNSGSGKTTVAKTLQKKFGRNTMLISQDMIRREILWVKDGADTRALPLLIELLKYGSQNSEIVILEGILYADWYAPLFECAKELFGDEIYAFYYDLPFEETVKRHDTRPQKAEFGEEAMQRWYREKDFMGVIPEEAIGAESALEETVERIYERVVVLE